MKKMILLMLWLIAVVVFPVAASAPGDLDPTFGSGGVAAQKIGDSVIVYDLLVLANGSTLIAGTTAKNGNNDFFLARFDNSGTLDLTFGNQGIVITDMGMMDYLNQITLDQNGNIVGVGSSHNSSIFAGVIVRYNANGVLDATFSGDGQVIDTRVASLSGLVIDANNRIVAAGRTSITEDEAVVRYNPDGTSDITFDADGLVTADYGGVFNAALDVILDSTGKIVVGGVWKHTADAIATPLYGTMTRYNTDGSPDTSFDTDGHMYATEGISSISVLAADNNGRIIAAGTSYNNAWNWAVARFNADGSSDTSFLQQNIAELNPYAGTSMVSDMVIDGNGQLILSVATGFPSNFAVVRLNPDGSADTTFSGDGVAVHDISTYHDRITAVGLDANGNILAAGYAGTSEDKSVALVARYHAAPVEEFDLIPNTGFEIEGNWKVIGATADRRVCYPDGEQVGKVHSGLCSFQFRGGAGENSTFVQQVDLSQQTLQAGDQLSLSAYIVAGGAPSLKVQAVVKYTDMSVQRINVRANKATRKLFIPVGETITLTGTPTSIKLKLTNTSLSGRIYVDDLRLIVTR